MRARAKRSPAGPAGSEIQALMDDYLRQYIDALEAYAHFLDVQHRRLTARPLQYPDDLNPAEEDAKARIAVLQRTISAWRESDAESLRPELLAAIGKLSDLIADKCLRNEILLRRGMEKIGVLQAGLRLPSFKNPSPFRKVPEVSKVDISA